MSPTSVILRVAVDVPLSRSFDYRPPANSPPPSPGSRVRVPFGRRQVTGVVMEHGDTSELAPDKLKASSPALDDEALLRADDLALIRFTSDYYHHPIGEVVAAALPNRLRAGKPLDEAVDVVEAVEVADTGAPAVSPAELERRAPRQAELLRHLLAGGPVTTDALTARLPQWRRAGRALIDKGLIRTRRRSANDAADMLSITPGPALNPEQAAAVAAVAAIAASETAATFGAFVLDGVTGSGKTEVYLKLIENVIRRGRQVLVLVPEIGLTPQLLRRFERRLGFPPALLHSGLGDSERLAAWRRARSGSAAVVIGTRSAVFTPLPSLGLVIVDEEHDPSLKQQEGLRYSARDLAVFRAKRAGIPVVLGSATPTLEVLKHCEDGSYAPLRLKVRAGGAEPPVVRLVDLVRHPASEGISEPLLASIERHLDNDGQVLLFLNRRGFAPTLICSSCAYVVECARCDARMTVHAQQQELRCHHCGARAPIVTECPKCTGQLRPLGEGTERLEQLVTNRFPDQRVVRIDSDSVQAKGALSAALALADSGDARILIGTQMLSKGHHFRRLSLVGIVNADHGLFGSDFRSAERLAQSIVQVAGRAGRESRRGEVIIQTGFPDHRFWQRLLEDGYSGIARDALTERRESGWPPYTRLALIRASAHRRDDALACLHFARRAVADMPDVTVLGPVDAPMARRAGRCRAQLLLKSNERHALHAALRRLRPLLESAKIARRARWSIDVDPVQLF